MEPKDLKKVVTDHFDKQVITSNEGRLLDTYGSDINNIYLRSPYLYVEEDLLNNLRGKRVLDYCCGSGVYSIYPALKGATVYGLDISQNSIDTARKRANRFELEAKCNFSLGDAERMDYQDNFFDIVLSYGSLSYLDIDKSLSEIKRVLVPGGTLIIIDSLGHNPLFNANRKRNVLKYAPNHYQDLKTLNVKEINDISSKHFLNIRIQYFDFLTVLGYGISKVTKITFGSSILKFIDKSLSRIPVLNKYFFKAVITMNKSREEP
jgi:ubiquinone/menaquinone biosynthesis C-methylase UbiE